MQCPYCRAPRRGLEKRLRAQDDPRGGPLGRMLVFYGLMLGLSVVYGLVATVALGNDPRDRLLLMVGLETVDTVLVVTALLTLPRPASVAAPTWPAPLVWVAGAVALAVTLAVNQAYHAMLRAVIGGRDLADPLLAAGVTPLVVLAFCVQPAVVEELFFRGVVLDRLRATMNVHLAALVSAVMFGLAHVGAPLSIPMLALVGLPLAYARMASGGLLLPMAFHFLHNLAVLLANA